MALNDNSPATLIYNGIQFGYVLTTNFSQETVYDASGTDYLYTKVIIQIRAIINAAINPAEEGETPADTMVRMRACLMQPRAALTYNVTDETGAHTLISAGFGNPDANNGPKPQYFRIYQFTGNTTFVADYAIEVAIFECNCGVGNPNQYTSNRWKESHDIDENGYVTRTIAGQMIFNSQQSIDTKVGTNANSPVDQYRTLLAPPSLNLLSGFRRIKQEYLVREDGLALQYTIVDRQEYTMPPGLATKFEAEHIISTMKAGGIFKQQITVRCWGGATTAKADILTACFVIAFSRLGIPGPGNPGGRLSNGAFRDKLEENFVEIRLETFATGNVNNSKINIPYLAQPALLDGLNGNKLLGNVPDVGTRGTSNLHMIVLSRYMQACIGGAGWDEEVLAV